MKKNKIIIPFITLTSLLTVATPLVSCSKDPKIPKTCTINFTHTEGGELVGSTSLKINQGTLWQNITTPNTKIDVNYTFDGWYIGAEQISSDFVINGDITVNAVFKYGITWDFNVAEGYAIVKKCDSNVKEANIPTLYKKDGADFPVKVIGESAFYMNQSIEKVTLPNGIETISDFAFSNCHNLKNINLPDTLKYIGENALYYCHSLTSIKLPNNTQITYGEDAFKSCESLENIIWPNNITSISKGMFAGCKNLKNLSLPNSVVNIDENAFYQCCGLTSISIPANVETIGENAFYQCYGASVLSFNMTSNKLNKIAKQAFYGCSNFSSLILPNSVTIIEDRSFAYCQNLASVNLSTNLKSIGAEAFLYCKKINSLTLPTTLETIGDYAFYGPNINSNEFSIPKNLTTIGKNPFATSSNIKKFKVNDENINFCTDDSGKFLYNIDKTKIIAVIQSITQDEFKNNIGGVQTINSAAFESCKNIKDLSENYIIKNIGENAFRFSGLTNVNLLNCVEKIGVNAFNYCNLNKITISNTNVILNVNCFANSNKLNDIYITCDLSSFPENWDENVFDTNLPNNGTLHVKTQEIGQIIKSGWKQLNNWEIVLLG